MLVSIMIQSVDRALEILSLFSYSRPRWGIAEISSALGLTKGTTHNIVHTLYEKGFLTKDQDTRKYALGPMIFTLGAVLAGTLEINQKSEARALRLAEDTDLACRVAIWDQDAALITFEATPRYTQSLAQKVGPRVIAYCSAVGRALLAYLDPSEVKTYFDRTRLVAFTQFTITEPARLMEELEQTRGRAYAVNNQELALGRASLAVPVFRSAGLLAASISLSGSADRVFGHEKESFVNQLRAVGAEISRSMGFSPEAPEDGNRSRSRMLQGEKTTRGRNRVG